MEFLKRAKPFAQRPGQRERAALAPGRVIGLEENISLGEGPSLASGSG